MDNRRKIGTAYEERAAEHLRDLGYRILERNFRCRLGEIDLIAEEAGVLVFLEVKYRKSSQFGNPAEAVTPAKQKTICRVADFYRMSRGISESRSCRFDVAAIMGEKVQVYKDAFPYR
ncbi:MAG: YraN family protein [Lachnospiraceae bacterium]|jgi:putative endonuclease|nr:YraN family protein [Lachnospiraceae bacterium]